MFDVYTGTKAGRPTLLLLLAAGALVGTLGLAWMQVRGGRALGEEVRIEGTPLTVRPPKGWLQDPRNPGVFVKTVRSRGWRRERWVVERKIEFYYKRWRTPQSLLYLLKLSNYRDVVAAAYEPESAPIGRFDGVQIRRARVFEWRGRREVGESIYRLVSTPRGDQISVEYTPLGELSPGDMELFDAVCKAVTLDDSGPNARPD